MAVLEVEKEIKKIYKKTIDNMTALGTYREQFNSAIMTYAEAKYQLKDCTEKFYENGAKVTEEYTNKAGATNERKTALYMAIEQLRRDISAAEDRLGLSPVGMKRINESEMKMRKKTSKLSAALEKIGR